MGLSTASVSPKKAVDAGRIDAKGRLIVALNMPTLQEAKDMVKQLDGLVSVFKIGLNLSLLPGEEEFVFNLIKEGKDVFIDYKYFDIPETVKQTVKRAAELGVKFLTVHSSSHCIKAAVEGKGDSDLKVLAVTVLTSLDDAGLKELGYTESVLELVLRYAKMAANAGSDGVIASALEAEAIHRTIGNQLLVVSPAIRPSGSKKDDQKRVATPSEAINSGADYLVVGRPIYAPTGGQTPKDAAARILDEMQQAFDQKTG